MRKRSEFLSPDISLERIKFLWYNENTELQITQIYPFSTVDDVFVLFEDLNIDKEEIFI